MITAEHLKKLRLFSEASAGALDHLAKAMQEKIFSASEVVLREGDATGSLYLIASGSVSVEKKIDGERSKVVARLGAEEFFGEMAFLENQPHSATIVAAPGTTLYVLPRAALDGLIVKDPSSALNQVLVLLAGISSRLRHTTDELVTVFEVARLIGLPLGFDDFLRQVLLMLGGALGAGSSVAFYRWNPFNDEYNLSAVQGPGAELFPVEIEIKAPLLTGMAENFESIPDISKNSRPLTPLAGLTGHLLLARSDMQSNREGFFICYNSVSGAFDSGKRQMMETLAAVLAPAFSTARNREEEQSRQRLERSRHMGYSL